MACGPRVEHLGRHHWFGNTSQELCEDNPPSRERGRTSERLGLLRLRNAVTGLSRLRAVSVVVLVVVIVCEIAYNTVGELDCPRSFGALIHELLAYGSTFEDGLGILALLVVVLVVIVRRDVDGFERGDDFGDLRPVVGGEDAAAFDQRAARRRAAVAYKRTRVSKANGSRHFSCVSDT